MEEIFKRVSVRNYEKRAVEPEKVTQILKAAMAAPSALNQQPWEFYVVTDREKTELLSKCSPYSSCAAKAPLIIVPCFRTAGNSSPEFNMINMSIATENILLEVTALGLGAVWLSLAPFEDRMEKAEKIMNIDKNILRPFALVPIGYPVKLREQQNRFDESRIHYI